MHRFLVSKGQVPRPLLGVLQRTFPAVSRELWMASFRRRKVYVNDFPGNAGYLVEGNDAIRIDLPETMLRGIPKIEILAECDEFAIIDKLPGLPVMTQDTKGGRMNIQAALEYYAGEGQLPAMVPCHRLDVYTGGTLLCAKNPRAQEACKAWFAPATMDREYNAVLVGRMPAQMVCVDYARKDAAKALTVIVKSGTPGARQMRLTAQVLDYAQGLSLAHICLQTGRTHQIRVQLSHRGYPVLGDDKYGVWSVNAANGLRAPALWHTRLALHNLPAPYAHLDGFGAESQPRFPAKVRNLFDLL